MKMVSKWILVSAIALALLSAGGSCQIQAGYAPQGSNFPARSAPVAGSWSLVLMDAAGGWTRSADLDIVQIGDVIFGAGSTSDSDADVFSEEIEPRPTEDQGIESMIWWLEQDPEPMAQATTARSPTIGASGLVSGMSLDLDLVFLEENLLYRLDLNVVESSISGTYQSYDSFGRVRSGSCYGSIRTGYGQSALSLGSKPEILYLGGMTSR